MQRSLGNERQISFFAQEGHNHDGVNSTPVELQQGQVKLMHLDGSVLDYMLDAGIEVSSDGNAAYTTLSPVQDLTFTTPTIMPGQSYTGSVEWVGMTVVRFVRVVHTADSQCDLTFYHSATYADEDREFRAEGVQQQFLWEGAWVHYDEDATNSVHFRVENTSAVAAAYQITLKAGTMVTNDIVNFVSGIRSNSTVLEGQIDLVAGSGVTITEDVDENSITISATPATGIYVSRRALVPVKVAAWTSSAAISNVGELSYPRGELSDYATFGQGRQWIKADLGGTYSLGRLQIIPYFGDTTTSRTYNDFKVEISTDNTFWTTVVEEQPLWSVVEGATIEFYEAKAVRYIRIHMNGSDYDTYNYLHAVRAFKETNKV